MNQNPQRDRDLVIACFVCCCIAAAAAVLAIFR
jgi:hypothetical protein